MASPVVTTPRLVIRGWHDDDIAPLAAIGAVPDVVRYLRGVPWSLDEAAGIIATNREVEDSVGVTMWALEDRRDGALVGYCGFAPTNAACVRADLIEIGWALAHDRWGEGLATEAAAAVMPLGVERFGRSRIVSKCHIDNLASERVMRRLGMRRVGVVRAAPVAPTILCRFPA